MCVISISETKIEQCEACKTIKYVTACGKIKSNNEPLEETTHPESQFCLALLVYVLIFYMLFYVRSIFSVLMRKDRKILFFLRYHFPNPEYHRLQQ